MVFLPQNLKETLGGFKKNYPHYLQVKLIKGQYCVFECSTVYLREFRKRKKITHYIGRILLDGKFIKAKPEGQKRGICPDTSTTDQGGTCSADDP